MFVSEYTATVVKTQERRRKAAPVVPPPTIETAKQAPRLSAKTVTDIIATAVYAAKVGATGRELDMLRSQWGGRSRELFDMALAGARQGNEWAK